MFRLPSRLALAVALAALCAPAGAQERVSHPHLRAALHELRDAKAELKASRDDYPPGYRERAFVSIDAAMKSVQAILSVKSVDTFTGVERNTDYYRKFKNKPRLRAAVADLRQARDELKAAKADFGGHKEEALDCIDIAVGDILVLIRTDRP